MSATSLDVFDKTLQTTNIWLNEIGEDIGPDRQLAWAALGAVLRTVRDRIPVTLAAHLAAELPLLVRGAFYDQYQPEKTPTSLRTAEAFLEEVEHGLAGRRPVGAADATKSVLRVLSHHIPAGQCEKVRSSLPEPVRKLWPTDGAAAA